MLGQDDLEALRGFLLEEVIRLDVENNPGFWTWVMDKSWLDECLSMKDGCEFSVWEPWPTPYAKSLLYGIPIKLAAGNVFPRLEREDEKASA